MNLKRWNWIPSSELTLAIFPFKQEQSLCSTVGQRAFGGGNVQNSLSDVLRRKWCICHICGTPGSHTENFDEKHSSNTKAPRGYLVRKVIVWNRISKNLLSIPNAAFQASLLLPILIFETSLWHKQQKWWTDYSKCLLLKLLTNVTLNNWSVNVNATLSRSMKC